MENKISACIIVFNEEEIIRKCLNSIKDAVDEIIVVHDGECIDKTLEICKSYTNKIFIKQHIGEAEPHRPFGFKQATGDWILQIDADEFLSIELRGKIKDLVKDNKVDAYEFLWPFWNGKERITKRWPHKRCLFRKEKISFLGIPHFVVQVNGKIKKSKFILGHHPDYNNFTWHSLKTKYLKWARIHAAFYLKDFKEVEKYSYHEDEWPFKIKMRVKFSIFLMPLEFIITFFKNILSGGYKEGKIGYKVALMLGVYKAMINYYIFKSKLNT